MLSFILTAALALPLPALGEADPAYRPRTTYEQFLVAGPGSGVLGPWGQALALRELFRLESPARFACVAPAAFWGAMEKAAVLDGWLSGEGK